MFTFEIPPWLECFQFLIWSNVICDWTRVWAQKWVWKISKDACISKKSRGTIKKKRKYHSNARGLMVPEFMTKGLNYRLAFPSAISLPEHYWLSWLSLAFPSTISFLEYYQFAQTPLAFPALLARPSIIGFLDYHWLSWALAILLSTINFL